MLHILIGDDDFSRDQALEEIKSGIGDPAMLATNTIALDGQQVTLNQLKTAGETMPFLAAKRLVIVKGLLERFGPKAKSGKKTTRAPSQPVEYKPFADEIKKMPDSTVMVLVDGSTKNTNPLLKELASKAQVRFFPRLQGNELKQWLQERVAGQGGIISAPAAALLAKMVGGDLWAMANEIDKLVLFAAGRRIEEADVKSVVSYEQQTTVFAMVDAILECRVEAAQQALQQLLQKGAAPAYLMTMLGRQAQLIVRAKELKRQGKARTEIQSRLGLTADFAVRKTLEQADRYTMPRLKEVYRQLLGADLWIKTGKYDSELALNILAAELCQPSGTAAGKRIAVEGGNR
ncbi:MAG: DNA polymerase III subunit delta [Chloroflexota bacterium]|nr:DNA polymerase III subunit delta [Chloroflexota bacterium]